VVEQERVRVEIGFDGGQIMGALVTAQSADELERELASANGKTIALDAADGRYVIALGRVVYVKRFVRDSRVGFGAA
jgi:hypothetical protein